MKTTKMTLPTELACGLINNDWSILDYIDDSEYTKCVSQLMQQLEYDGLNCVDVIDNEEFCTTHDMTEFGVLATDCSTFIFN